MFFRKFFFIIACLSISYEGFAQKIPIIKFNNLEEIMSQKNDTTYIFNFWATFCKPCVAELENFETIDSVLRQNKVKVILVSLDFVKEQQKLQEFIEKRKIKAKVLLLDEPDYDKWIDKISPKWTGSLPATLIINNTKNKKIFFEQTLDYQALTSEIKKVF
jgi:peroxiredoxin